MQYEPGDVLDLLKVSRETLRDWSLKCQAYLSPTANPPREGRRGRKRLYNDSDLEVLALVAAMRAAAGSWDEILASLAAGQRAPVEAIPKREPRNKASLLALQEAQTQVRALENRITALQAELIKREGQIELLERQLVEARAHIDRLNREIGRLGSA